MARKLRTWSKHDTHFAAFVVLLVITTTIFSLWFLSLSDPKDPEELCENFCMSEDTLINEKQVCVCDSVNAISTLKSLPLDKLSQTIPDTPVLTQSSTVFNVGDCWRVKDESSTSTTYGVIIHVIEVGMLSLNIENWNTQAGTWSAQQKLIEKKEVDLLMEKVECPK